MTTTVDQEKEIRWKATTRLRDRNRARFLIRERIVTESSKTILPVNNYVLPTITTPTTTDTYDTNTSSKTDNLNDVDEKENEKILHYYKAIALGSASVFSLVALSRDYALLSSSTEKSTHYWSTYKIQTLCTSRFGHGYAKAVLAYRDSIRTSTMLEYAALLGEYGVVGAILSGGIIPLFTTTTQTENYHVDCHDGDGDGDGDGDDGVIQRKHDVSTIVMKKLLVELMPLTLAVYIVKSIIEMKMWGVVGRLEEDGRTERSAGRINMEDERGLRLQQHQHQHQHQQKTFTCCPICFINTSKSDTLLLRFSDSCNHWSCEICMWQSLIENMDRRIHGDVVCCPICDRGQNELLPPVARVTEDEVEQKMSDPVSTIVKCRASLHKFQALPLSARQLKKLPKRSKSKNSIYSTWNDALLPVIGASQDVRKDKFIRYINLGALHHVRACLEAGVDVDLVNEYNQTPLHIACWRKHTHLVALLIDWGADVHISAHGDISILNTSIANNNDNTCDEIVEMLKIQMTAGPKKTSNPPTLQHRITNSGKTILDQGIVTRSPSPLLTILIPNKSDHIGSGACFVDYILPESTLSTLDEVWRSIPVASANTESKKKKLNSNNPCSLRSYFCDSEDAICSILSKNTLRAFQACDAGAYGNSIKQVAFFSHMRFLNYNQAGGELAPHIDLTRVDSMVGKRSTHTFLLYMKDCELGGETALLKSLTPSGRLGNYEVLAEVEPRRGRLLLFPHACPHRGMQVVTTPKVLIRGEVFIEKK